MNEYLSKKISFFHFVGLLFVLQIHAFLQGTTDSFTYFEKYITSFCHVFQPMYFGIAGYLFFLGINKRNHLIKYKEKLLRRMHSLLIPYVIWNIAGCVFFVFLIYYDVHSGLVEKAVERIPKQGILSFTFKQPALGQLWFVKHLMILAVLSYPLYLFLQNKKWYTLIILFIFCLILPNQFILFSLFSYAIGAYIAINGLKLNVYSNKKLGVISVLISLLLLLLYSRSNFPEHYVVFLSWITFLSFWMIYDSFSIIRTINIVKWGGIHSSYIVCMIPC